MQLIVMHQNCFTCKFMYLNGILIVEGKDDESLIKSFLECYVFKTNGFDIKDEDIRFLNKASEIYEIIVLTDPDEAGEKIRKTINEKVKNTFNVFLDKKMCDKNNKHGVAESTKEHILERLGERVVLESPKYGNVTLYQLHQLGLNGDSKSKEKRKYICDYFSLGICNVKTMKERINLLNISVDEISKVLIEYGNK